jgi:phosphinothricin acetyltransferase
MVKIRPATENDLPAINDIYNEAVLTTTATFDTQPRTLAVQREWLTAHNDLYPVLVADVEQAVVGWASLSRWSPKPGYAPTAEVSLYVSSIYRGNGFGKTLMAEILVAGEQSGFHTVLARIVEGNEASIRLHHSFGFELVGVIREVGQKFGRWLDVYLMQKIHD